MRLFTALPLTPSVQDELDRLEAWLNPRVPGRRWVRRESRHLTVHFLGEVPEARLVELQGLLEPITGRMAPFDLTLGDLGVFPTHGRPRVLWEGVAGNLEALTALELEMRRELARIGLAQENRPYAPHLTLLREPGAFDRNLLGDLKPSPLPWRATHLILFQSELAPSGARYSVVKRFELAGGS